MKEIGGYIEFGNLVNKEYHQKALKFNSSRNSLRYFIKRNNIKKIYLPIYLCDVVYKACLKEKCQIKLYHIDTNFMPTIDSINADEYIYIVNYYGIISNKQIKKLKIKYNNVIIDNTHAFYQLPVADVCTIYNCRKYFGVPDGSYMYSNIKCNSELPVSTVKTSIGHLIGRLEDEASEFYEEFSNNDKKFDNLDIAITSKFSKMLLGAIDYKEIKNIRIRNYNYLASRLKKYQRLTIPNNLTFMYPLFVNNGEKIRKYLIDKKIYVPKLWPNIINKENLNETEKNYIENIIPLPIDQRYTEKDMEYIIKCLEEII